MEKVYWHTKDNDMIEINDLTDNHLYNILSMIQRKRGHNDMRIRDDREMNLEQLRTLITENKYIVETKYKEFSQHMQYILDKHHEGGWHPEDDEYYDDFYDHYQSWPVR